MFTYYYMLNSEIISHFDIRKSENGNYIIFMINSVHYIIKHYTRNL